MVCLSAASRIMRAAENLPAVRFYRGIMVDVWDSFSLRPFYNISEDKLGQVSSGSDVVGGERDME